jgi:small subunit ribosomal protein S23
MHNVPHITKLQAYDQARKEFYDLRLQEDIERRVAKEEAMSTGAYFGPSRIEIGMGLEDKEFERWKEWASKEVEVLEQRLAALYTGPVVEDTGDAALDADPAVEEAASEEVSDQVLDQGQSALGGAKFTR